jgi:hypothetical protein
MDREELSGIEKKALEQLKSGKSLFGKYESENFSIGMPNHP